MSGLSIGRRGAAAVVTLDRPDRRNEVSIDMLESMANALRALGRDPMIYGVVIKSAVSGVFSVGRDESEPSGVVARDAAAVRAARRQEYALCWQLECFSKPIVSLIDGQVAGTGNGLTLYGTHRVAGENYAFQALHESNALVPDCGTLYALARMPHAIGRYLALTGRTIGRADAYALGLVTHCIAAVRFAVIEHLIAEAEPLDPTLDSRHEEPGASSLLLDGERVQSVFGGSRLDETMERLRTASGGDRAWADAVLADLAQRSQLALALTDEALRRAATLDIDGTLQQDFRLAWHTLRDVPSRQGLAISQADVDGFFASLGADDLVLLPRAQMQAGRG